MKHLLRPITAVIVLLLTWGVLAPQPAHAAPAAATLTITNAETAGGDLIPGATYTVTQVASIDAATGESTPVTGATPRTVTAGETVSLPQYAVYEVTQATRAPGYYLDTETYLVEFPLMAADGTWAASQDLTITPKLIQVTGDATLLKAADGGTDPVAGAVFELYQTADATGPLAPPVLVTTLTSGAGGTLTAEGLTEGEYYFVEVSVPEPYAVDTTTTYPFTVAVDAAGTATAPIDQLTAQNYTAPAATEVIKAVNGDPTTSASINEIVTFTLTVQLPGDIASFATYTLTDTFDSRFSDVAAVDVPAGFTVDVAGNTVTATGDPAALTPGEVVLTFTARVNNTTASGDVIGNTADVTWDNGRGDAGTFTTNEATVTLVEGSLTVTKIDGITQATLPGATFVLTDVDGTPLVDIDGAPYEATTGADGTLTFTRLPFGTYYLRETAAPEGYRLLDTQTAITIDADNTDATATVRNFSISSILPDTGTWGVLPFSAVGLGLVALFFVLRRRQRRDTTA